MTSSGIATERSRDRLDFQAAADGNEETELFQNGGRGPIPKCPAHYGEAENHFIRITFDEDYGKLKGLISGWLCHPGTLRWLRQYSVAIEDLAISTSKLCVAVISILTTSSVSN